MFNSSSAGDPNDIEIYFVARDDEGSLLGGVFAVKDWDWVHLQLLFVDENSRQKGIGGALLARVEQWAGENGCSSIFLDTFTFQAEGFYLNRGYKEFGRLNNFPQGHSRVFLKKNL
ncbi:MAG: GNAT family N-acetyltransferase [Candidatus Nanopelagicaceae bacterium]|nr:GNAT family N-acetyltransferase [Candidatus Nanopelagicaceae bacterium]